jgi:ligand-binding SRPBCC domain-containing protein
MASTNVPPEEFICPLTLEVMTEPVMTRLGHNFELSALLQWLERHDECPLTRNPMTLKDIIVNRALQERIEFWRKQHTGEVDEASTEFDKKLPLVVLIKSSKTVIKILEETKSPLGKSILGRFRRDRRAMKQRKRRAAAA